MKSNSNMKVYLGLFLILCVVTFTVFLATPSTQGQKEKNEEATIVQKGRSTEKEKEFSKEYRKNYPDQKANKLSELSKTGNLNGWDKEIGMFLGEPSVPTIGFGENITATDSLKDLSCAADAVVIGSPTQKAAHMLDDESFVYTEYDFQVTDVLKNNYLSPIESQKSISVTRPGGLIKLDNQLIRVEDRSYKPFELKKNYIIFLKYVPSAGGYVASSVEGDFLLEGNSFKKHSTRGLPKELEAGEDKQTIISIIKKTVEMGCGQMKGDK